ncbi:MAG: M20/M25/M40 family metallo-hydrolase [Phycisphaerales bacterium]
MHAPLLQQAIADQRAPSFSEWVAMTNGLRSSPEPVADAPGSLFERLGFAVRHRLPRAKSTIARPGRVSVLALLAATSLTHAQADAPARSGPGGANLAKPTLPATLTQQVRPDLLRAHVDKLCSFGTRHTLSSQDEFGKGIGAARQWLVQAFEDCQRSIPGQPMLTVYTDVFEQPAMERMPSGGTIVNVVAVIPGTMDAAKSRRYYVSAHYDTIPTDRMNPTVDAPGANDNASGTAALLEIARVIGANPLESTVVLLATAGEEQGLLGAKWHAGAQRDKNTDIRAVLNNDIIGDPSPAYNGKPGPHAGLVRVFSEGLTANPRSLQLAEIRRLGSESDSPSRQIARYIFEVAQWEKTAVQPVLVFRPDRFMRGGDHLAFNDQGYAGVRFTAPGEDYTRQHQDTRDVDGVKWGDRPEFVDAEYVANVTRLNLATLVHLANAPSEPANVRIITAKLEQGTTLRWEKSPEPDVAGYEVVWRDTTAPLWQHARDMKTATEATLEISKDNVFFGVRAYDKDGYRSPVSFAGAAAE